jgi:hypothetical protein
VKGAAFALAVCAAVAAAQVPTRAVLHDGPAPLAAERVFEIAPASRPRLLFVRGVREKDPAADATLRLDAADFGTVAGYEEQPGRFVVALQLLGTSPRGAAATGPTSAPTTRTLRIRPLRGAEGRVTLERVEIVDAARLLCVLRDQATKRPVDGVVQITAVDGATPPLCGPLGAAPREGAAWISDDGGGELWTPLGAQATLVGRGSPFRAAVRFRRRLDLADGLALTFFLPPDQRPEGARILEILDDGKRYSPGRAKKDRALDVGARVGADWTAVPADEVLAAPDRFVARLVAAPDQKLLVTNESDARLVPTRVRQFVTVRLVDGSLIHSNAPLPLFEDLKREGAHLRGWLKVRCPEDARLEGVYVSCGPYERRYPIEGPTTLPLDVLAPPGEVVTVVVKGTGFDTAPPLERPLAVRVFRAP